MKIEAEITGAAKVDDRIRLSVVFRDKDNIIIKQDNVVFGPLETLSNNLVKDRVELSANRLALSGDSLLLATGLIGTKYVINT